MVTRSMVLPHGSVTGSVMHERRHQWVQEFIGAVIQVQILLQPSA